jgi:hypothetical protein
MFDNKRFDSGREMFKAVCIYCGKTVCNCKKLLHELKVKKVDYVVDFSEEDE